MIFGTTVRGETAPRPVDFGDRRRIAFGLRRVVNAVRPRGNGLYQNIVAEAAVSFYADFVDSRQLGNANQDRVSIGHYRNVFQTVPRRQCPGTPR